MPLPWYKWRVLDWMHCATRFRLSLIERGLYRELLDIHYAEGSIPADKQVLQRMTLATPEEFEQAWANVGRLFAPDPEDPERLVNEKAIAGLVEQEQFRQRQSENGGRGGRPRKPKKNPRVSKPKPNPKPEETQKKPYTVQDSTGQEQKIPPDGGKARASAPTSPETFGYGEFGNVKLTTVERKRLDEQLGNHAEAYINRLDRYVEEAPDAKANGVRRKDKNAYPTILNWFDRDKKEGKIPGGKQRVDTKAGIRDWIESKAASDR